VGAENNNDLREEKLTYHRRVTAFASTSAIIVMLGSTLTASAQTLELRISTQGPTGTPDTRMVMKFIEELENDLGDNFEYEFFNTGALGDEIAHMQMIRSGQIDVYPAGSDVPQLDNNMTVFELPFLFSDRDAVIQALDAGLEDSLRASLRSAAGVELLAFGEMGFRQIINNVRPIETPEDLEGVKLRVPGNAARQITFTSFGATPVTMGFSELYLAMQQGTIDGQEGPIASMQSASFYEVADYLSLSNHVYTPVTLLMNGNKFDSLSDEHKEAVLQAARAAAEFSYEQGRIADDEVMAQLRETMTVNEIDYAAFQEAARPVWDEIRPLLDGEIVDTAIAAASGASN